MIGRVSKCECVSERETEQADATSFLFPIEHKFYDKAIGAVFLKLLAFYAPCLSQPAYPILSLYLETE